jgi:hypothetical protein
MNCRQCDDPLPADCPPIVTTCKGYANWRAHQRGDMLTEAEAIDLTLLKGLCALDVAIRDGLELLPELD